MVQTRAQTKHPPTSKRGRAIETPSQGKSRKRHLETVPSTSGDGTAHDDAPANTPSDHPIEFWRRQGRWPSHLFEPSMEHVLAQRQSSSPLLSGRKRSYSSASTTPSDQKPREEKSAYYLDPRYETLLATKGSFMTESDKGVAVESKIAYMTLLTSKQTLPTTSLFQDELFNSVCASVGDRNEARVLRFITPLIVPSAEELAMRGSTGLKCLVESMNEGWNNSIPLIGIRPQPDYSVGFRREAFTDAQLEKLSPFIGDFLGCDISFFMATYYMYFPFLTCEVKCGAALDVADRQNAHSSTLAARGIVELFRLVKRENEVHRQILSFSISHDNCSVRIYGHYPVIDGTHGTKYYRHPIQQFDYTAVGGKERWTAYRFIKNVYDNWAPDHFKRISSAIDQLPTNLNLDVPPLSESTGLS
ncbi:hypothetical protein TgHK011_008056 [Trichoderma gracile]|nr:hypothetical protein TgHK011_008056 [Trichoderma gracile]